jgi:O-antigen ligase
MSTEALPRAPRLVPFVSAMAASVAVGYLARLIDVKILAAAAVGLAVMFVIRVYPMLTLFGLAAGRATLEVFQAHNVLRAGGVSLSPADLLEIAFAGGVAFVLLSEIKAGGDFWRSPIIIPAAFFIAFGVVSLGYSQAIGEGARGLVKWTSAFGAYALLQVDKPDARRLRLLLWLILGSSAVPLLYGVYQLLHGVGRQNLLHGGLRIQSTFDHPNDYGFYLVVVLVAAWGLYNVVEGRARVLVMAVSAACFVSAALTLSRSAYAALGLVVIVVGWKYRRLLLGLAAVGGAIVLAIPRVVTRVTDLANPREGANHGNSLLGRLSIWSGEVAEFRSRPFLGHGWGFTLASQDKASHNDYLRLLVEGGIVGFFTIVVLVISILRAAVRAARDRIDLPRAYLGLAMGYAVGSGVTNTIGKGAYQFYFWLMTGIALRWAEIVPAGVPARPADAAPVPEPASLV